MVHLEKFSLKFSMMSFLIRIRNKNLCFFLFYYYLSDGFFFTLVYTFVLRFSSKITLSQT